jgi:nitrogen regulatory protein PII
MMAENCTNHAFELLTIVVNEGCGTRILHIAQRSGVCGATIMLGRGTVNSAILKRLELYDEQKEIVLILAGRLVAFELLDRLNDEYRFNKPHHGIAFCIPVARVYGSRSCQPSDCGNGGADTVMYNAIYVIVDEGNAEAVIDAATKAGSRGGTVINARGSGIHETSRLFNMEIEPEKEIVLIISESGATESIATSIRDAIQIEKPGNGIMFVQDVSRVYGLR